MYNCYPVCGVRKETGLHSIDVQMDQDLVEGLSLGASVAISGVCLSVTKVVERVVSFDVMQETLSVTTLGSLDVNSLVNVERSLKWGDEIGGHQVSGHIDAVATVVEVERLSNNHRMTLSLPLKWMDYIFNKGFIAINGCSLTVCNVRKKEGLFDIWLIPETLRRTTFAALDLQSQVNIEIDRTTQIIVDTTRETIESYRAGESYRACSKPGTLNNL